MHCPFCGAEETRVVDSRLTGDGDVVRRRRECLACQERFTTQEKSILALPMIIKRDEVRVPFDEDKLRGGMLRALEKRPVNANEVDLAIEHIIHNLRTCGEREVKSRMIGEWVMEALERLDHVAYVRFASVYRSFQDVQAFREEIERLEKETMVVNEPVSNKARQASSDKSK